jgi:phage/plasmid-associated DNA primase
LKLREEAGGILNRLLEGTARWKRERLKAPMAILNAADEYRRRRRFFQYGGRDGEPGGLTAAEQKITGEAERKLAGSLR